MYVRLAGWGMERGVGDLPRQPWGPCPAMSRPIEGVLSGAFNAVVRTTPSQVTARPRGTSTLLLLPLRNPGRICGMPMQDTLACASRDHCLHMHLKVLRQALFKCLKASGSSSENVHTSLRAAPLI